MALKRSVAPAELLSDAIAAIYDAGVDAAGWPRALAALARTMNGRAAIFESFDLRAGVHREMHAFNVPPPAEMAYLAHHIAGNPRWADNPAVRTGDVGWDYQFIDEKGMNGAPFYAELLAAMKLRYFISGVLVGTPDDLDFVSVQYSARQGHAGVAEIRLMNTLLPHLQRAHDVRRRLASARGATDTLAQTLEWLDDGVAIVSWSGAVTYANPVLQEIMRRADVVRVRSGQLEFKAARSQASFDAALGAVCAVTQDRIAHEKPTDFAVARTPGLPPYLVSVRPLAGQAATRAAVGDALVFIRDPLGRSRTAAALLRDIYGLTVAECDVALAVQSRTPLGRYAQMQGVSINTVYTHLRHIREKTGAHSVAELILILEDLRLPLRPAP